MLKKDTCQQPINALRAKVGIEAPDENIIATLHLMNTHGIDIHAALDQSSRSANDHGIDAWHYVEESQELFVYQSKLTESRVLTLRGLTDLDRARQWLEQVIIDGIVDDVPSDNNCLFNLYTRVSSFRSSLKAIRFALLSLFDKNDLEDLAEYHAFESELVKSKLNAHMRHKLSGRLAVDATHYNLESSIPERLKVYSIPKITHSRLDLRRTAHLELAYVSLYTLVALYRERGDVLFDKNVRLSLLGTKEARDRLLNPMDNTFDLITNDKLSPNIFPFYHLGVTIAASGSPEEDAEVLKLEAPSIINGCQTIAIANEYLKKLEKQKNNVGIDRFKQIKVVAKVVVGTSNDELKEITNSNNRQNPIENWQLFSNEPIHVEIEATLKDVGIFYERQKGKFLSVMKNASNAQHYHATNGTFVRVVDLGQIIALSRHNISWAAKPSDIFVNKDNHDKVFDRSIPQYRQDIVFVSNLMKALKRGLKTYLELAVHANSNASVIFNKPLVRAHTYHLGLLNFYQSPNRRSARIDFSTSLTKIASPKLVEETHAVYQRVVTRIRNWYTEESKQLAVDVSRRRLDAFFMNLATEVGVDPDEGAAPFSANSLNWQEIE